MTTFAIACVLPSALNVSLATLGAAVAAAHVAVAGGPAALPVVLTEHQSHDNADWDTMPSTSDHGFEASRLAFQMLKAYISMVETCAPLFHVSRPRPRTGL